MSSAATHAALALARDLGARTVQEDDGAPNLNTALKRATVVAQVYASRGVLIVPADLPLLNRNDVRGSCLHIRQIRQWLSLRRTVIKKEPTHYCLSPSNIIEYDFGEGSFERHCARAKKAGARLEVVNLPSLELDLDLPEDLELIRKMEALKTK